MRTHLFLTALAATSIFVAACGDSTGPTTPTTVTDLAATPVGTNKIELTWTGTSGEGYKLERATGAATAFALIATVDALAADGMQTYTDSGLVVDQDYSYRITSVVGNLQSTPSASVTTTACAACVNITGDITSSRTLFADTVYKLVGFIHVANGATLTIQPGTKIRGDYNTLGSSLFILRGAKIDAQGTADKPIVFTSSRLPGERQPGDWGGLLIVGNAINNRSGSVIVEGTGTDGSAVVSGKNYDVVYNGGTTATDNSGTLKYVRVEFAGFAPVVDNEFNGFTFAAVGSGTRMSYLQTLAPLDDSYEFFGGGFDIDHIVAFETADDMFDMSEGWVGRMQFLIGINTVQLTPRTGAGFYATDMEGLENDGCNGSGCDNGYDTQPFSIPLVANFTLIGCGKAQCVGPSGGHGMMIRRGMGGYYVNGVVARFPTDGISLRDQSTYDRAGATPTPSATADLQMLNIYFSQVNNLLFQAPSASQFALDPTANSLTLAPAADSASTLFVKIPQVGATPTDVNDFDFTPANGAAIATGGLTTFAGAIATKAGSFASGTSYRGAVDPAGPKWWQGWTYYARN